MYPLFIFLLLAQVAFLGYCNVYFTFPVPCWAIPLERWQCLVYFLTLCDSVVHDACFIYIYAYICAGDYAGDCAFFMMDSRGYVSNPL